MKQFVPLSLLAAPGIRGRVGQDEMAGAPDPGYRGFGGVDGGTSRLNFCLEQILYYCTVQSRGLSHTGLLGVE
jgi:hypothetical protein